MESDRKSSRRRFLKNLSLAAGSGIVAKPGFAALGSSLAVPSSTPAEMQASPASRNDLIIIRNPKKLSVDRLQAERVLIGKEGGYKPCVVRLHGDELLLVNYLGNVKGLPTHQYRSTDGGRTWRGPENTVVGGGGEPYLTKLKDGTLLLTGGPWGYRSEDGGATWVKHFEPDSFAARVAATGASNNSRNVLQLQDGSLLQIVDIPKEKGKNKRFGNEYIARSTDNGRSWSDIYPLRVDAVPEGYHYAIFDEAHLWQAQSGKLYAIARIDHQRWPLRGRVLSNLEIASMACSLFQYGLPPIQEITQADLDQLDRLMVFSSDDMGHTWQPGANLGDYGNMYPSILRLQDGRLLLTFTDRSIDPPLGVRAVLGTETADGFTFDFAHDMILIDTKTPIGRGSGGGFGPTVQLDDGTLVTSYSYWPPSDKRKPDDWALPNPSQCEVARWRLPATT